jgi:hypothetical protein
MLGKIWRLEEEEDGDVAASEVESWEASLMFWRGNALLG